MLPTLALKPRLLLRMVKADCRDIVALLLQATLARTGWKCNEPAEPADRAGCPMRGWNDGSRRAGNCMAGRLLGLVRRFCSRKLRSGRKSALGRAYRQQHLPPKRCPPQLSLSALYRSPSFSICGVRDIITGCQRESVSTCTGVWSLATFARSPSRLTVNGVGQRPPGRRAAHAHLLRVQTRTQD